jgi:hypothetical protein
MYSIGISLPSGITGGASGCSFGHGISQNIDVRTRIQAAGNQGRAIVWLLFTGIDLCSGIG